MSALTKQQRLDAIRLMFYEASNGVHLNEIVSKFDINYSSAFRYVVDDLKAEPDADPRSRGVYHLKPSELEIKLAEAILKAASKK